MKKGIALFGLFLLTLISVNQAISDEQVQLSGSLEGAFSSWGKTSLQGDWKIVSVDGKTFIELAENFKAKEGPDVKIFLSPLAAADITGKNAAEGSAFVYEISSFEGENRIEVPSDIDLGGYQTLVFHCEEYSKLWGISPL